MFGIHKPCIGSINKEWVAAQEAEMGIMEILAKRPSVKVWLKIYFVHSFVRSFVLLLQLRKK